MGRDNEVTRALRASMAVSGDMVVTVGGEQVRCYSWLLRLKSKMFDNLLATSTDTNIVLPERFTRATFDAYLSYITTGTKTMDPGDVIRIAEMCEFFMTEGLFCTDNVDTLDALLQDTEWRFVEVRTGNLDWIRRNMVGPSGRSRRVGECLIRSIALDKYGKLKLANDGWATSADTCDALWKLYCAGVISWNT